MSYNVLRRTVALMNGYWTAVCFSQARTGRTIIGSLVVAGFVFPTRILDDLSQVAV